MVWRPSVPASSAPARKAAPKKTAKTGPAPRAKAVKRGDAQREKPLYRRLPELMTHDQLKVHAREVGINQLDVDRLTPDMLLRNVRLHVLNHLELLEEA